VSDERALVACLQASVPGLRAAVLFGSCLSPATRRPSSIPDVFALVDDLEEALAAFGLSRGARRLCRGLAPATLALGAGGATGPTLAKLNLATPAAVADALARLPDLTLAGRLAKKSRALLHRDAAARAEVEGLLEGATLAMARTVLLGLPRRVPLAEAGRRCFALSYRAELRPERQAAIAARYDAFADDYRARYEPRIAAAARARGIGVAGGLLVDERPERVRRAEARALAVLLWRGRLRSLVRWSREPLLYRGWLPYLVGKLRRAWG
jgi:hypothetical protein